MIDLIFVEGQKVRIKSWEQMEKEFGTDSEGDINCTFSFTIGMEHLCGKIVDVKNLISDTEFLCDGWAIHPQMIDELIEESKTIDILEGEK